MRPEWVTLPNAITVVRLALVVPLVVLILDGSRPVLALALLVAFGASDWVDGFLARRLGQTSRVGETLDPVADRVGVAVIALALAAAGHVPLWVVLLIGAVDVALGVMFLVMRPDRAPGVTWLGKVRTAALMAGIALIGLGLLPGWEVAAAAGVVLTAIGAVLHLAAGYGYARAILRDTQE